MKFYLCATARPMVKTAVHVHVHMYLFLKIYQKFFLSSFVVFFLFSPFDDEYKTFLQHALVYPAKM
jgi:hypothetical protein